MAKLGVACPISADLMYGGIVGSVLVVDNVERHPSPWFRGPHALVLADPRPVSALPGPAMIKIAITEAALVVIAKTLPEDRAASRSTRRAKLHPPPDQEFGGYRSSRSHARPRRELQRRRARAAALKTTAAVNVRAVHLST
jgi:hypothetical protein